MIISRYLSQEMCYNYQGKFYCCHQRISYGGDIGNWSPSSGTSFFSMRGLPFCVHILSLLRFPLIFKIVLFFIYNYQQMPFINCWFTIRVLIVGHNDIHHRELSMRSTKDASSLPIILVSLYRTTMHPSDFWSQINKTQLCNSVLFLYFAFILLFFLQPNPKYFACYSEERTVPIS